MKRILPARNMKEKESERTGVSYAIQAIIFGQRGAFLSGLVLTNSRSESAASRPPILNAKKVGGYPRSLENKKWETDLWPQSTIFTLPQPRPKAFSRCVVLVVSQSAKWMTALSLYEIYEVQNTILFLFL
jgi:hypothetical protein